MEVRLSSSAEKPRVRLVAKKTEVEIPVAQEPPVPEIKRKEEWDVPAAFVPPEKKKKKVAKTEAQEEAVSAPPPNPPAPVVPKTPKAKKEKPPSKKQLKKLAFQERYERAKELSSQYPGMSVDAAHQALLGVYTVEEWLVNRKRKQAKAREKAKTVLAQRRIQAGIKQTFTRETLEWQILQGFLESESLLQIESGKFGLITRRLTGQGIYKFYFKDDSGVVIQENKLRVASIGLAADMDLEAMRVRLAEEQLFKLDKDPKMRWSFPHELLNEGVGRKARVVLVNNSVWSGHVLWCGPFSFGLAKDAKAEKASVIIYKHACCGVELS